jgi:hypothetical protein
VIADVKYIGRPPLHRSHAPRPPQRLTTQLRAYADGKWPFCFGPTEQCDTYEGPAWCHGHATRRRERHRTKRSYRTAFLWRMHPLDVGRSGGRRRACGVACFNDPSAQVVAKYFHHFYYYCGRRRRRILAQLFCSRRPRPPRCDPPTVLAQAGVDPTPSLQWPIT